MKIVEQTNNILNISMQSEIEIRSTYLANLLIVISSFYFAFFNNGASSFSLITFVLIVVGAALLYVGISQTSVYSCILDKTTGKLFIKTIDPFFISHHKDYTLEDIKQIYKVVKGYFLKECYLEIHLISGKRIKLVPTRYFSTESIDIITDAMKQFLNLERFN